VTETANKRASVRERDKGMKRSSRGKGGKGKRRIILFLRFGSKDLCDRSVPAEKVEDEGVEELQADVSVVSKSELLELLF
jgi:hypothetical protein